MQHRTRPEVARGRRAVRLAAAAAATASFALLAPATSTAGASTAVASAPAVTASVAAPSATIAELEMEMAHKINGSRWLAGLPPIPFHDGLRWQGRAWSAEMARRGELAHHPDLTAEAYRIDPNWVRYGENVGVGGDVASIHRAFMGSATHRAQIYGDYRTAGVGIVRSGDRMWVTVRFLK